MLRASLCDLSAVGCEAVGTPFSCYGVGRNGLTSFTDRKRSTVVATNKGRDR